EIAKTSARGGFSLFIGQFLTNVLLAVASIIIARLLGPESLGTYSLSFTFPTLLITITSLGIDSALVMFTARFKGEGRNKLAREYVKAGFIFRLLMGAAGMLVCLAISDIFAEAILQRPELATMIKIASIWILIMAIYNSAQSILIGLEEMGKSALMPFLGATCKTLISPFLIILGLGVTGAVIGHILSYGIATAAGSIILLATVTKRMGDRTAYEGETPSIIIRNMIAYSLPLYVLSLVSIIVSQFQLIILANFVPDVEIGNYTVAMNLSALITVLTFPISTTLFPAFSKLSADRDGEEIKSLFKLSTKYSSLVIIPVSTAVIILAREIVLIFYGEGYSLAPPYLALYAITFLYAGLGSLAISNFFNGIGETRITLATGILNAGVLIPSAYLLTKHYGVSGLIIAIIISGIASLAYGLLTAHRKFKVAPDIKNSLHIYATSALSTIPLIAFLHTSPFNILINTIIGTSIYLAAYLTFLPLLKAINSKDIENLKLAFSDLKILWPIIKPILACEEKILTLKGDIQKTPKFSHKPKNES
ncbi:MAG: flippase, partial [Nitrososphaerota archaeon]|nr:flippase [Nitrososphaerota archaeon]